MSRDSILEIQHKREQSHDSGTYQDWTMEEAFSPGGQPGKNGDFVTVVAVDEKPFVTVLSVDNSPPDSEEVLVYRLPGERLGLGLKFEGGVKSAEKVKKLLIQSCADDSPASRTRASWGPLSPGDEILIIDSVPVSEMTRMDCVRALKESNVVIKLRVRKATNGLSKEEDKEAPPIPPRKFPRKKELAGVELSTTLPQSFPNEEQQKNSPPVQPRSRQIPQAELYTDLISQESVLPTESESDDTGSSISTVVSRISSTPTTCNSSFSDAKSINSVDFQCPSPSGKPTAYDLDKVLEPFLHLEREFSSAAINENNIFHKLAEATNLIETSKTKEEESKSSVPKPAPRQERRRPPPPPPPPPRTDRQQVAYPETRHLPRLIDFVPKDRTDVVVPSPLLPTTNTQKQGDDINEKEETKEEVKEVPDVIAGAKRLAMDTQEFLENVNSSSQKEYCPPTFSRLPPDGHEFDSPPDKPSAPQPESAKSLLPPTYTKELKLKNNIETKKIVNDHGKYLWRNDEKSEKSVKDKIAMFSSVQNNSNHVQTVKMNKKQSNKVIDNHSVEPIIFEKETIEKIDFLKGKSTMKKCSLPYQSLFDVTGNFDSYKNSIQNNNKTQSTLDLTDNSITNNIPLKKEFSTLPRKSETTKHSIELKSSSNGSTSLSRALSFSGETKLHNRSQSLVDVGSRNPSFLKHGDDLRRSSLAALTEQRKKNFSKLRGLVIPEKVVEVPSLVVDDLPVIKSTDCLIPSSIDEDKSYSTKSEIDKFLLSTNNNKPAIDKASTLIPSSIWKTDNTIEIPKYSPAFKRKSLSLYGTSSSVSSVSSSLSSSREELRTCFYDTPKTLPGTNATISKSLASLPRQQFSTHSEPKSLESITSPSISDLSYEFAQESLSPNLNACNEVLSRLKYNEGYGSDSQRSKADERGEEESDNDSAVSSSRSSISPPHSPMPGTKKNDNNSSPNKNVGHYDLKLKRTLSSETTASNSSSGSTLTSGSQASCSSSGTSSTTDNKRVLKPQSVEAINRKNVLSSARYSSGIDSKVDGTSNTEDKDTKSQENYDQEDSAFLDSDLNITPQDKSNGDQPIIKKEKPISTKVNGVSSPTKNDLTKNNDNTNKHVKEETSFDNDDFSYSNPKKIDKNSNLKMNDYNDVIDGIISSPNANWQTVENHTEFVAAAKISKPNTLIESKNEKNKEELPLPKAINVNSMKKVFEKVEPNSYTSTSRFKMSFANNQNHIQHPRVSSVDSTNSDDSCVPNPSHYGSASNLLKEQQFGSITSLASSTSLISQQELSQLIEEANHTLEDEGNSHEVVVVILYRDTPGGSIGITLAGGADYEAKEITVHKVLIGSPAERDGRIQKGDRILSINGKSMKGLTHYESLGILKAPRPEVVLVVSRHKGESTSEESSSKVSTAPVRLSRFSETKTVPVAKGKDTKWGPPVIVSLVKDGAGLGFSLEGGKDSPYGDQPLLIKKIFTGGCAEKCGNLFAGDELLSVNNIDVSQLSRIEAWSLMKRLPDGEVLLVVRHPFA